MMRYRFHSSTIRSNSSETEELVIGKQSEETKNYPRTEMQLVQYNLLSIPHDHNLNLDTCQEENPLSTTTTGDNYYREPTMGELNAPNFETQPWCIYESPELENITINASVAHSLPKFSGAQGESATTHLQRLHGICQNLKPNRVNMDDFKLKAFLFFPHRLGKRLVPFHCLPEASEHGLRCRRNS
ncbi:unnamed protein product [Rhodiola kirilowii]